MDYIIHIAVMMSNDKCMVAHYIDHYIHKRVALGYVPYFRDIQSSTTCHCLFMVHTIYTHI